jgi:DNA-binding transcriptional LysR family regulator
LGRAAERLFMAQPPLSRRMHQVEDELGVLLFEKNVRPLRLTVAGVFFEARARWRLPRLT